MPLDATLSMYSERIEGVPYIKAYTKDECRELFSKFFGEISLDVRYNVIDLPSKRKIKIGIPDEYELGWHLIIKCKKL